MVMIKSHGAWWYDVHLPNSLNVDGSKRFCVLCLHTADANGWTHAKSIMR